MWGPEDATVLRTRDGGAMCWIFSFHVGVKSYSKFRRSMNSLQIISPSLQCFLQLGYLQKLTGYSLLVQAISCPNTVLAREEIEVESQQFTNFISNALQSSQFSCVPNINNCLRLSSDEKSFVAEENAAKHRYHHPRDKQRYLRLHDEVQQMLKPKKE